jgi:hypothetical protein
MAGTDAGGNGSGTDQLRQLVREVLAEALPGLAHRTGPPEQAPPSVPSAPAPAQQAAPARQAPPAPPSVPAPLPPAPPSSVPVGDTAPPVTADTANGPWTVRLSTDDDLHAFVVRVLKLADNPKLRRDLIGGRIRFSLAGQPAGAAAQAVHRVEAGAVTERTVVAAARAGARLVLGSRAVLTPLARDKARALGVPIEKER